jgi:hypothetical protein
MIVPTTRKLKLFLILFLITITGCASFPKGSGFFDDYSVFHPGPEGFAEFAHRSSVLRYSVINKYKKIMLEPVLFYFDEGADYKGIHLSELNTLASTFHKVMEDEISPSYPFVDSPGPDVILVRAAITNLDPDPGGPEGLYGNLDSATIEMEFLDSQTNERLIAYIAPLVDETVTSRLQGAEYAFQWRAKRIHLKLDGIYGKTGQ